MYAYPGDSHLIDVKTEGLNACGIVRKEGLSIPVLRGCPLLTRLSKGGPTAHTLKINEFGQSFEQIFLRKVELQVL